MFSHGGRIFKGLDNARIVADNRYYSSGHKVTTFFENMQIF